MNQQQITKQYSTILICLALVSMLIMFATPFITAFKMDLGLISGSETGMDYITNIFDNFGNMFDFEADDDKNNSSTNDWFDEDKYKDYTLIEEDIEKLLMGVLAVSLLACAVLGFFKVLSSFSHKNQDTIINESLKFLKSGLTGNIAYYIFCMYIILKGHEWDFESILSGDAIVTTKTYIPMIFQIIVFAVAMFLYKHWGNAISGKTAPLNLGIGGSAQSTQTARTYQPKYQTSNTAQSTRSEMENLELLKKYKELFDTGIITEEEFNVKKKELLATNSNVQTDHPTEQKTETNKQQPTDNSESQEKPAEKELSRTCHKCGYTLTSSQQVCPHCGTQATVEKEAEAYGMKWYKFLIYFLLYASAVLNAISAIMCFTGAFYDGFTDILDFAFGVYFITFATMALQTRSELYRNKRRGPKLLCALYILNAVGGVMYPFGVLMYTGQMLFYGSIIVITLVSSIVMAIVNHIYFKKRKDMFTY